MNICKDKFVLTEWPESQEFIGHPDCYLLQPMDHNERQLDSAYFVPEDLYVELNSNNKQVKDIEVMYDQYSQLELLLRESMRHYLSRLLMDHTKPLTCSICLQTPDGFGLSSNDYPHVRRIYQDPMDGIIYFSFNTEGSNWIKFDNMNTDYLLIICREINA